MLYPNTLDSLDSTLGVPSGVIKHGLLENTRFSSVTYNIHKYHEMFNHLILYMAVCQNLVSLVNIKIAGKWMFIPLKMVLIGIDPYPYQNL